MPSPTQAPQPNASETQAHTIHRIEAFSDIVIGFCLAQVGANLVLPKSAAEAATLWSNVGFFLASFTFIIIVWWFHHRIFSKYFVLNAFGLVMNFIILAGVVLTSYFFQVFVHTAASSEGNPILYLRIWLYSFANVYTMLGILLIVGMVMRRAQLSAADMRWGIQRTASIATGVAFFAIFGATAYGTHDVQFPYQTIVPALIVVTLFNRAVLPRLLKQWIPDRA